jgi:hypothetical protein
MKLLAGIDNFFDDLAQLIDLYRKNAAIRTTIVEFVHGRLKRAINRFHAMAQQILEANDERETESTGPRLVYDFEDIDRAAEFLKRTGDDVALLVDREIPAAPAIDIVGRNSCINVPFVFHFVGRRHLR